MGSFLDKPNTDKCNENGEGNELQYGVASMQGWRCEMEDAHYAKTGLGENWSDWSYFAVFDGHAGVSVSAHCAKHLLDCILQTEDFQQKNFIKGIREGFLNLDENMRTIPDLYYGVDKSGTTAVCAFVGPENIFIANCGDSRAILCRNGEPVFSTQDHKPILPGEKERIMNAGGSVMIQRVNGSLAVSRALGDYEYKNVKDKGQCEQLVSPEPEIFCLDRDPADEFLVLACDGIWDVMTNEDVCRYVQNRLRVTSDLKKVTNSVIDTCFFKGSRDNMSIIIIVFPGGPKPTQEAIDTETELNQQIYEIIQENSQNPESVNLAQIIQTLNSSNLDGIPPGGGMESKYPDILSAFNDINPGQNEDLQIQEIFYMQ